MDLALDVGLALRLKRGPRKFALEVERGAHVLKREHDPRIWQRIREVYVWD